MVAMRAGRGFVLDCDGLVRGSASPPAAPHGLAYPISTSSMRSTSSAVL